MKHTLIGDSLIFARRDLEHIRQVPEKLTNVTIQPLMFVLLFSFVFGGAINVAGGGYKEYLLAGVLIQTIAFNMLGPGTAIATDLQEGVIDRFRVLPAHRSAYMVGHYLAELAGSALAILILLVSGLIVGWRPHSDVPHFVEGVLLLLAFASAMIWIGLWVGALVRSPDAVMGIGFVVIFPLTFLSNAFVPVQTLPNVLQWIAYANPISVIIAAIRTLFKNPVSPVTKHLWPIDHPVAASWIYIAILLWIGYMAAQHRYRSRTND